MRLETKMITLPFRKKLLLVAIIFLLVQGVSYGSPTAKSWKLSSAQRKYVKAYGNPELFMLVYDHLSGKGPSKARRIESWIYLAHSKFVIFDNGFFSEEQPTGAEFPNLSQVPRTPLQSSKFHAAMTQSDITRIYGKPDTIESSKLGSHTFTTMRYLKRERRAGILNVTFYDDKMVGVVAGFAIQPPEIEKLRKDLERGTP
jgi:hypothetical protein